eukprot:2412242-Prorocentrum_lima.AAC.1
MSERPDCRSLWQRARIAATTLWSKFLNRISCSSRSCCCVVPTLSWRLYHAKHSLIWEDAVEMLRYTTVNQSL